MLYNLLLVVSLLSFSMGAPSFSGHFSTQLPQLTSAAPSFPTLTNKNLPTYSSQTVNVSMTLTVCRILCTNHEPTKESLFQWCIQ